MRFNVKVKNERATGSRCIPDSNRQACTATCFSTSEVTPAYGIFHFKKGKKQPVFLSELLVK